MSFIFRKRSTSTTSRPVSMRSNATTATQDTGAPEPEVLGGAASESGRPSLRRGTVTGGSATAHHSRERSRSGSSGVESHVRSGFLLKKGVVNQAYKKRWFILTTRSLLYFEEQPTEAEQSPRGAVPLALVTRVDVKGDGARDRFLVVTPTRVFKMRAESVAESEAWVAAISGAVEMEKNLSGGAAGRQRRPSGVTVLDLLRMDGVAFAADARIHAPAELNKWESWSKFEVAAFLSTFNMAWQAPKFFNAGITGAKLAQLSSTDLERIGVKSKEDRLAILRNISSLVKGEIGAAGALPPPLPAVLAAAQQQLQQQGEAAAAAGAPVTALGSPPQSPAAGARGRGAAGSLGGSGPRAPSPAASTRKAAAAGKGGKSKTDDA